MQLPPSCACHEQWQLALGDTLLIPSLGHPHPPHPSYSKAGGRKLVFLANVDPVDAVRSLGDLNPETTLAIVVSKTFTTAETMLNARTARQGSVNWDSVWGQRPCCASSN